MEGLDRERQLHRERGSLMLTMSHYLVRSLVVLAGLGLAAGAIFTRTRPEIVAPSVSPSAAALEPSPVAAAPRPGIQIFNIHAEEHPDRLIFTWETDRRTDTRLRLGRDEDGPGEEHHNPDQERETMHMLTVEGVTRDTLYFYRIVARAPDGVASPAETEALTCSTPLDEAWNRPDDSYAKLTRSYVDKLTRMTPDERDKLLASVNMFIGDCSVVTKAVKKGPAPGMAQVTPAPAAEPVTSALPRTHAPERTEAAPAPAEEPVASAPAAAPPVASPAPATGPGWTLVGTLVTVTLGAGYLIADQVFNGGQGLRELFSSLNIFGMFTPSWGDREAIARLEVTPPNDESVFHTRLWVLRCRMSQDLEGSVRDDADELIGRLQRLYAINRFRACTELDESLAVLDVAGLE